MDGPGREEDGGGAASPGSSTTDEAERKLRVAAHEQKVDESDEEEEQECRVCRGPAEEGRPLYAPCKCSGSIGLTHQDCLTSWLAVTRGDGRCELCSVQFQFAPKYAAGAPDQLPPLEVLLGLSRRFMARWLPLALRGLLAASLWLCVVPLATAYLYEGWMHRPSAIAKRWKWELVPGDAVSGAVVAAVIIVSFLSLMSFADFLRFHWQQQAAAGGADGQGHRAGQPEHAQDEIGGDQEHVEDGHIPDDEGDGIDDGFLDHDDRRRQQQHMLQPMGVMDQRQPLYADDREGAHLGLDRHHDAPQPQRRPRRIPFARRDQHRQEDGNGGGVDAAMEPRQNVWEDAPNRPAAERLPEHPVEQRRELQRRALAAAELRRIGQEDGLAEVGNGRGDADQPVVQHHHDQEAHATVADLAQPFEHPGDMQRQGPEEAPPPAHPLDGDEENIAEMMRLQEEQELDEHLRVPPQHPPLGDERRFPAQPNEQQLPQQRPPRRDRRPAAPNDDRFEPQFEPLDPVFDQDEAMDMEIHVALDELLGLRGPLAALIRNLLWLLAFNTTYIGLFAFIPHTIGESVYGMTANSTSLTSILEHIPYVHAEGEGSLIGIVSGIHAESTRLNTALQLPDLATVGLGYMSLAIMVFVWQGGVALFGMLAALKNTNQRVGDEMEGADGSHMDAAEPPYDENEQQPGFAGRNQEAFGGGFPADGPDMDFDPAFGAEGQQPAMDVRAAMGQKLSLALECAAAIVKVGILLFLKMLLLPLLLGIWLDVSTLSLFGSTVDERVRYAGADLFGSVLLHWVAGITFMLLVTVSVLQLREVAHPDLLARVIRPQEPQPDLLGNLLQESGTTHAKRMLLSLCIYAALLTVHIWLPVKFLVILGIDQYLPFFHLKLWHIVLPQLQVPVELLIFHLSMLAFLEKYKNRIGEMQHSWLLFMCDKMGLTDHILPHSVEKFVLVGARPVFLIGNGGDGGTQGGEDMRPPMSDPRIDQDAMTDATSASSEGEVSDGGTRLKKSVSVSDVDFSRHQSLHDKDRLVDPFWRELTSFKDGPTDEFVLSHICLVDPGAPPAFEAGTTRRNGHRVLSNYRSFIRLPYPKPEGGSSAGGSSRSLSSAGTSSTGGKTSSSKNNPNLIPTTVGAYRLRRRVTSNCCIPGSDGMEIEFWREVAGNPIARPPEGWDDLGVGGAEVQGRWAWGKETKSETEQSVARRLRFFGVGQGTKMAREAAPLVLKMLLLVALSWLAILAVVCVALSAPLVVGRFVFFLLRIPERCVHDPMAFAVGGVALFPITSTVLKCVSSNGDDDSIRAGTFLERFVPSLLCLNMGARKLFVLAETFLLWFVLTPVLIGTLYDMCLVKSRNWWSTDAQEASLADWSSMAISWGTGTLFLNVWAVLCYHGVLTKGFWLGLGIGVGPGAAPPGGGNDNADGVNVARGGEGGNNGGVLNENAPMDGGARDDPGQPRQAEDAVMMRHDQLWQGPNGRINAFAQTLGAILFDQEWDKVDKTILIESCAMPVARQLCVALLGPLVASLCWFLLFEAVSGSRGAVGVVLPLIGFVDKGLYRLVIFRTFSATMIAIQLGTAFRSPLQHWFRAAHKAARDDRYLVGEILMDYAPPFRRKRTSETGVMAYDAAPR